MPKPPLLILAIALAAPIAATALYFLRPPQSFTHAGELLSPPAPLPAADEAGKAWRGKWLLFTAAPGACGGSCQRRLCIMRQTRLMQHGSYPRIARAWFLTQGAPPAELKMTTDCGVARAAALKETAPEVDVVEGVHIVTLNAASRFIGDDHIYLADPEGRAMMRYRADVDPYELRRDFKRLLRLSQRRETR